MWTCIPAPHSSLLGLPELTCGRNTLHFPVMPFPSFPRTLIQTSRGFSFPQTHCGMSQENQNRGVGSAFWSVLHDLDRGMSQGAQGGTTKSQGQRPKWLPHNSPPPLPNHGVGFTNPHPHPAVKNQSRLAPRRRACHLQILVPLAVIWCPWQCVQLVRS